jgi:hypothetical protein
MNQINYRTERIIPTTEQRIKIFEELIGSPLPQDYRTYLELYPGADPYIEGQNADGYFVRIKWNNKYSDALEDYALLESPYMLIDDPNDEENMRRWNDLRYAYRVFKERIPEDTIIIWDSGGADRFLLGIKNSNKGKIYFWSWNNEEYNEGAPATYGNIAFVANCFSDFIQLIEPEPDDWDAWEAAGKPHLPLESDLIP